MPAKIFDLDDLNVAGICHAISCKWVRESVRRGAVTSEADLGSRLAMFIMYEQPDDMDGVITSYHLDIRHHDEFSLQNRPVDDIMDQLVRGGGYRLLGLGSYRLSGGEHQREGHTMAYRLERGGYEFFDPNAGAWSFANSRELRDWMPGYLRQEYPLLLGTSCDLWEVTA